MNAVAQVNGSAGMTKGALLLQEAGRTKDIAAALGVSNSMVSAWKRSHQCPKLLVKKAMFKLYGIPVEAWSEAV